MGYTTTFYGEFYRIEPPLTPEHLAYLKAFANTRRMKRDEAKAELLPDPLRIAAGLPIGFEGAYYVGSVSDGNHGQNGDDSVLNHNDPPGKPEIPPADPANPMADWGVRWDKERQLHAHAQALGLAQPGLWCQWRPNDQGTLLEWDEGEKFYDYVDWLQYLVTHFFVPWGYVLNGECEWEGEERDDMGKLIVTNNKVTTKVAHITWK